MGSKLIYGREYTHTDRDGDLVRIVADDVNADDGRTVTGLVYDKDGFEFSWDYAPDDLTPIPDEAPAGYTEAQGYAVLYKCVKDGSYTAGQIYDTQAEVPVLTDEQRAIIGALAGLKPVGITKLSYFKDAA